MMMILLFQLFLGGELGAEWLQLDAYVYVQASNIDDGEEEEDLTESAGRDTTSRLPPPPPPPPPPPCSAAAVKRCWRDYSNMCPVLFRVCTRMQERVYSRMFSPFIIHHPTPPQPCSIPLPSLVSSLVSSALRTAQRKTQAGAVLTPVGSALLYSTLLDSVLSLPRHCSEY